MLIKLCALLLYCLTFGVSHTQTYTKSPSGRPNPMAATPTIQWDKQSLRPVSDPEFYGASYARLIELHDGTLLCVYEGEGSVYGTRSTDKGGTWPTPVPVALKDDGTNMSTPDVLELHDKSILVSYNPRPYKIDPSRKFGIRTRKSYDGGTTWQDERLLYEAGHNFTDGCWEPSAIQLPDGEIQLFFADESSFGDAFDQHIALLRSTDSGLTWTTQPQVISHMPDGRDGMPAPLLLANGQEIVCAIEQTGWEKTLKPAILRSTIDCDWNGIIGSPSPHREQPLVKALDRELFAGAPYLRQLSTGETLLSFQSTEGRINKVHNSDMHVLVGDEHARSFTAKSTPFKIPPDRFALWNSISVLKDGTIIALTSTNAFSMKSEIWMIKGHLIK